MMTLDQIKKRMKTDSFTPLWRIVYDYYLENIVNLTFQPSEKLNEVQLAGELGISRSPVKLALDRLLRDDLVEKRDGKGYRVAAINYEDCCQLCEARIGIEGHAAHLAAKHITVRQLEKLEEMLEKGVSVRNEEIRQYPIFDHSFHKTVVDGAHNKHLSFMYDKISNRILRYRHFASTLISDAKLVESSNIYHNAVFHALKMNLSDVARYEIAMDIRTMYQVLR